MTGKRIATDAREQGTVGVEHGRKADAEVLGRRGRARPGVAGHTPSTAILSRPGQRSAGARGVRRGRAHTTMPTGSRRTAVPVRPARRARRPVKHGKRDRREDPGPAPGCDGRCHAPEPGTGRTVMSARGARTAGIPCEHPATVQQRPGATTAANPPAGRISRLPASATISAARGPFTSLAAARDPSGRGRTTGSPGRVCRRRRPACGRDRRGARGRSRGGTASSNPDAR